MSVNSPVIEVIDLVKRYNGNIAVDGVSFSITRGKCFGLLGPNGAGKTTTVEMMENIISPDAGTILYKGGERDVSFNQEVGIQFQHTELLNYLTIEEILKTFASFYDHHLQVEKVISLCMLEDVKNSLNNKVSGGQKQRLLLGLALLNDPDLLFLDEPSTGLDPQARQHVWEIIKGAKKECKTIVLTTHYMEEAQYLCDEVAIMDHGKIMASGTPRELIKEHCKGMDSSLQNLETVFLEITGRH